MGKGVAFFATTTSPKRLDHFADSAELVKKSYRFGDTEQFGGVTEMAHNRFQTGNSSLFELVTKLHQFRV